MFKHFGMFAMNDFNRNVAVGIMRENDDSNDLTRRVREWERERVRVNESEWENENESEKIYGAISDAGVCD